MNYITKYYQKIKSINVKGFVKKYLLGSEDSNIKLSISVSIGVLIGILPIWGFQTILAILTAFSFKLNKAVVLTVFNISTPPFTPIIILSSYFVGGIVSSNNSEVIYNSSNNDIVFSQDNIYQYVIGSVILAITLSVLLGTFTFLLLWIFRKKYKQNLLINNGT